MAGCLNLLSLPAVGAPETETAPLGFMAAAMEYIHNHIESDLTLDGICRAAHVSKYHFCRKFKQITGITVMDYILKTRLLSAKQLLAKTKRSVSEISEDCGFSSISYFCRIFREKEGRSPLEYRKTLENKK